ncbi:hypothetical protein T439DRAFT_325621 [Meredithblackwellia eburnea MCA 4105]
MGDGASVDAERASALKSLLEVGRLTNFTSKQWFPALERLLVAHNLFDFTQPTHLSQPILIDSDNDPKWSEARYRHRKLIQCMDIIKTHLSGPEVRLLVKNNPKATWNALKRRFAPVDVKKRAGILRAWYNCSFTPDDPMHLDHQLPIDVQLQRWLRKFDHLSDIVLGPTELRTVEVETLAKDVLLSNLPPAWMDELFLTGAEAEIVVRHQLSKIAIQRQEKRVSSSPEELQNRVVLQEEFNVLSSLYSTEDNKPPPPTPAPSPVQAARTTLLSLPPELLLPILDFSLPDIHSHPFLLDDAHALREALHLQSGRTNLRLVSRHFASILGHPSFVVFKNTTKIKNFIQTLYMYPERRQRINYLHIHLSVPSRDRNRLPLGRLIEQLFALTPRVHTLHVGGPVALYAEFPMLNPWMEEGWEDTRQDVVFSIANRLLGELTTCFVAGRVDPPWEGECRFARAFEEGCFPALTWPNLTSLSVREEACFPAYFHSNSPPPFQLTTLKITGVGFLSKVYSTLGTLESSGCLQSLRHLSLSGVQIPEEPAEDRSKGLEDIWKRLWSLDISFPVFDRDGVDRPRGENRFLDETLPLLTSARTVTLPLLAYMSIVELPYTVAKVTLILEPLLDSFRRFDHFPGTVRVAARQRQDGGRSPLKIHLTSGKLSHSYEPTQVISIFQYLLGYWSDRGNSTAICDTWDRDKHEERGMTVELELSARRYDVTYSKVLLRDKAEGNISPLPVGWDAIGELFGTEEEF